MRTPLARRASLAILLFALTLSVILTPTPTRSLASSHREAPLIVADPLADNTDTYAFRSTEPGRSGFVTLIANWIPFQEPSGGPHFYKSAFEANGDEPLTAGPYQPVSRLGSPLVNVACLVLAHLFFQRK